MKLIPKNIKIPLLGETEHIEDPDVLIKIFHPFSSWTWFVLEYSPDDDLCFGLINGHEVELGYFSLGELRELRVMGLPVERDLHWEKIKLSELRKRLSDYPI